MRRPAVRRPQTSQSEHWARPALSRSRPTPPCTNMEPQGPKNGHFSHKTTEKDKRSAFGIHQRLKLKKKNYTMQIACCYATSTKKSLGTDIWGPCNNTLCSKNRPGGGLQTVRSATTRWPQSAMPHPLHCRLFIDVRRVLPCIRGLSCTLASLAGPAFGQFVGAPFPPMMRACTLGPGGGWVGGQPPAAPRGEEGATPTYVQSNRSHVALIILAIDISGRKVLTKTFFRTILVSNLSLSIQLVVGWRVVPLSLSRTPSLHILPHTRTHTHTHTHVHCMLQPPTPVPNGI